VAALLFFCVLVAAVWQQMLQRSASLSFPRAVTEIDPELVRRLAVRQRVVSIASAIAVVATTVAVYILVGREMATAVTPFTLVVLLTVSATALRMHQLLGLVQRQPVATTFEGGGFLYVRRAARSTFDGWLLVHPTQLAVIARNAIPRATIRR